MEFLPRRFSFRLGAQCTRHSGSAPASQSRLRRYVLSRGDGLLGWSASLLTQMRENPYFWKSARRNHPRRPGAPEHLDALLAHTYHGLRDLGADLIVANYTHDRWRERLRRLGFFNGPSNYLLALSKPLASALGTEPSALDRIYVRRADGDGRLNL